MLKHDQKILHYVKKTLQHVATAFLFVIFLSGSCNTVRSSSSFFSFPANRYFMRQYFEPLVLTMR